MKVLLIAVCGLLAVLAGVEGVRRGSFRSLRPDEQHPLILIAAPQGPEDCESTLRAAAQRVRWMRAPCRLVCLIDGGDWETVQICTLLGREYPFLQVYAKENLPPLERLFGERIV